MILVYSMYQTQPPAVFRYPQTSVPNIYARVGHGLSSTLPPPQTQSVQSYKLPLKRGESVCQACEARERRTRIKNNECASVCTPTPPVLLIMIIKIDCKMIVHASVQKKISVFVMQVHVYYPIGYGFCTDLDSSTIVPNNCNGFRWKNTYTDRHNTSEYCTCSSRVLGTTNLAYAHIIIIIIIVVRLATTETTALRL